MLTPHTAHSSRQMLFEFSWSGGAAVRVCRRRLCGETALARRGCGGGEGTTLHGTTPRSRVATDAGRAGQRNRRLLGDEPSRAFLTAPLRGGDVQGVWLRISTGSAVSLSAHVRAWDSASSRV